MPFCENLEHLFPRCLADAAVSGQAVAALVALDSGNGRSAVFAVGGQLLAQRVQLLLHQPDGAARGAAGDPAIIEIAELRKVRY